MFKFIPGKTDPETELPEITRKIEIAKYLILIIFDYKILFFKEN